MTTNVQKLSLLSDMIAFAVVDGKLHEREYLFLLLIATELQIDKEEFTQLFHAEVKTEIINSEFERIQQFYRLALLMHCDGVLHDRERVAINEIGIKMGLNPFAIKRVLKAMEQSSNQIIDPDFLISVFAEQHN